MIWHPDWAGVMSGQPLQWIISGFLTTLYVSLAGSLIATLLTVLLIALRLSTSRIARGAVAAFVSVFRNTPLLVQLVLIYTGLPQVGIKLGVLPSALLALSLNEAAYLSETIRGGFKGVAKGQVEAAKALGLSVWQTLRLVQMPQVARLIIPPLGNSLNGLLKATSLASVISLEELMRRSQVLMQERFEVLELYCVAAVYYLVLTTLWNLVQVRLEAHYGRGYAETAVTGKGQPVLPRPAEAT